MSIVNRLGNKSDGIGIMKNLLVLSVIGVLCLSWFSGCGARPPVPALDGDLLQKYQEYKLAYFNGYLEKAESGFREIASARGDFYQARFMLGKTLFSRGKITEAEPMFTALSEQFPAFHEAALWAARSELANGRTKEARERLTRLLSFDSSDPRLLSLYAQVCAAEKDAAAALQYLKLSAQFEDEMALNHFEIARYYYQFGMKDKALPEIDRCLSLLSPESNLRNAVLDLKEVILKDKGDKK
jgi:tetratricopeptide (TPR) repeat protein